MGHVVVHRDTTGAWALEEHASLNDALAHVEQLRNVAGSEDVRLFEEVPLEVRTYYRVAVAGRPDDQAPAAVEDRDPEHTVGTPDATDATDAAVAPVTSPVPDRPAPTEAPVALDAPDAAGPPRGAAEVADAAPVEPEVAVGAAAPPTGPAAADRSVDHDLTALLSPLEGEDAVEFVDDRRPAAPLTPPPGTFPLGAAPVPSVAAEDDHGADDAPAGTASLSGRRASRFGREREQR